MIEKTLARGRPSQSIHGIWSRRLTFILAATGSAVGLGNIWKFPYIAGENGGGAFVLVYLGCIALVGIPIMVAEVLLGRRGRQSPIHTMRDLATEAGASKHWGLIGWSGAIAGFLILSYYSVIAGWSLEYILRMADGTFTRAEGDYAANVFGEFTQNPGKLLLWHTVFMVMSMGVVARGVERGLATAVELLMPALFILLLVLVGYAVTTGYFMDGVSFLFRFNADGFTTGSLVVAMGHAFFTLSLGMGAIMVYGSYMPKNASISGTVITVALLDTVVALVAGMAIFPIVFANELAPGAGPGLMFVTLPLAFGNITGGQFFGVLFFVLVAFAAWTSAISLIEPSVSWVVERFGTSRRWATVILGLIAWGLGIGTVLSFNVIEDVRFMGLNFFEAADFLTANIMLPLGGLAIAVFAAWVMKTEDSRDELAAGEMVYQNWHRLLRYVSPLAVLVIFVVSLYKWFAG